MPSTIDDIDLQARQGSVAAIIQLLNEHFASAGIRTRAVQDNGVLQLLVEAPTVEQLPQSAVVEDVRQVLESISPKGITKVNINSRIVQEQQLLWLDEIKRTPKIACCGQSQFPSSDLIRLCGCGKTSMRRASATPT